MRVADIIRINKRTMEDHEESGPSKKPRVVAADGGLTAFALHLAKKLTQGEDNMAFSPLSIYTTLGLLAAGARGKTLDELLALLGAASSDEVAELVRGLAKQDKSGCALMPCGMEILILNFTCGITMTLEGYIKRYIGIGRDLKYKARNP
jgi:serpin B